MENWKAGFFFIQIAVKSRQKKNTTFKIFFFSLSSALLVVGRVIASIWTSLVLVLLLPILLGIPSTGLWSIVHPSLVLGIPPVGSTSSIVLLPRSSLLSPILLTFGRASVPGLLLLPPSRDPPWCCSIVLAAIVLLILAPLCHSILPSIGLRSPVGIFGLLPLVSLLLLLVGFWHGGYPLSSGGRWTVDWLPSRFSSNWIRIELKLPNLLLQIFWWLLKKYKVNHDPETTSYYIYFGWKAVASSFKIRHASEYKTSPYFVSSTWLVPHSQFIAKVTHIDGVVHKAQYVCKNKKWLFDSDIIFAQLYYSVYETFRGILLFCVSKLHCLPCMFSCIENCNSIIMFSFHIFHCDLFNPCPCSVFLVCTATTTWFDIFKLEGFCRL